MNQTMATCAEVNLCINEAVLIQTVLVKKRAASTSLHHSISEMISYRLNVLPYFKPVQITLIQQTLWNAHRSHIVLWQKLKRQDDSKSISSKQDFNNRS